jgi:DNA-3-methyladenine glycosylase II
MSRIECLNDRSLKRACVELSASHPEMALVYKRYGPPPMWDRPLGFATLLNIILEQQVSLASAKACFDKLAAFLGDVTPAKVLLLNDVELKTIGFSRQKTTYARHLSEALISGRFDLDMIHDLPDDDAKAEMVKLKGVGEWTSDVYLLMAMLRPDVMPRGDIALHAAYQRLVGLEKRPGSDEFLVIAEKYRPFRSVAARLLWHFYLSERAAAKANARK